MSCSASRIKWITEVYAEDAASTCLSDPHFTGQRSQKAYKSTRHVACLGFDKSRIEPFLVDITETCDEKGRENVFQIIPLLLKSDDEIAARG